jgi:hypothetical protein
MHRVAQPATKGLRQFLDEEQQRAWLDGETELTDSAERSDSIEHRFKYAHRLEKLLQRPQADDVMDILRLYGATCLPIPRTTERWYWSVSCLPGSPDKPLVRVNASWMELFALQAAGRGPSARLGTALRSRIILHLSDFTTDGSSEPEQLDTDLLESCALRPEDMDYAIWRNSRGILIAKVSGAASIRHFLEHPHGLRAIRNFNLTHMNRGRNTYQASHCYSLADVMLGE